MIDKIGEWFGALLALAAVVWLVGSWITHVVVCFVDDRWGFLIAGALFLPLAWIHGTGLWLGWW